MIAATRKAWCWRVEESGRLGEEMLMRYGMGRRAKRSEGLCIRPKWCALGLASVSSAPAWLDGEWYGKVSRRTISERVEIVDGANCRWRCCKRMSQRGRMRSTFVYR
jgi:hypothetical protein